MSELTSSETRASMFLSQNRLRIAGAGLSVLAMAGCSGEYSDGDRPTVTQTVTETITPMPTVTSSTTSSPVTKVPQIIKADCQRLRNGSPNVQCIAPADGIYFLEEKNSRYPLASKSAKKGETFQLLRRPRAYHMDCYEANVGFYPLPKDGTGKWHNVFQFPICGDLVAAPQPTSTK